MAGLEESFETEGLGNRSTSLAKALSRHESVEKVLIINCPRAWGGRLCERRLGRKRVEELYPVIRNGAGFSVMRLTPKLYMLNTTVFFPETSGFFSEIERKWAGKRIARLAKKLGFEKDVLWITNPRMVDIVSEVPSRLRFFDAIDDLRLHPQLQKFSRSIRKTYEWVESQTDFICIAAEAQRGMFPKNTNLFLMPNGVDGIFLSGELPKVPLDLARIPKPVVSYVGALQERIDVGLVSAIADTLPNAHFVFIGPELSPSYFETLKKKPNVYFLGPKRFEEIPAYIHHSDVCVIPHKIDAFTRSMNPLKIYEYLACGKPVVSTPVAGVEPFKPYITLADDPAAFSQAIRRAVSENSSSLEEERKRAALEHSWDKRVDTVIGKIHE